jgi:hypothetical protein
MAGVDPGELQTLLVTLQQTNTQLGQIAKVIAGSTTAVAAALTRSNQPQSTSIALLRSAMPEPDGTVAITLSDGEVVYVPFFTRRP